MEVRLTELENAVQALTQAIQPAGADAQSSRICAACPNCVPCIHCIACFQCYTCFVCVIFVPLRR